MSWEGSNSFGLILVLLSSGSLLLSLVFSLLFLSEAGPLLGTNTRRRHGRTHSVVHNVNSCVATAM